MSHTTSRSRTLLALGLTAALTLGVAACGSSGGDSKASNSSRGTDSSKAFKVAWVYVGPKNDGGWSQAHDEGRQYAATQLGTKVETTYKENIPEGPQAKQVIENLVKDGNKLIFATSFGYGDALKTLAKKYPDVKFEHATGAATDTNLATYFGAAEDTNYLAGIAAGAAIPKGGKVGFVAPFAIPEVIRHINAFEIGVQKSNPTATTKVEWTNTWFGPTDERKAADSLISSGVNAIASGQDSPASGEAAKAKGLPYVGYDSDQSKNFPSIWLTASLYHWGPYYVDRIKAAMDGSWKKSEYYGGIKDGFVSLAPFGSKVSADTKATIEAQQKAIVDGTYYEFQGPLSDQAGKERVKAGDKLGLGDILSIDWFVKGVEGNPKG